MRVVRPCCNQHRPGEDGGMAGVDNAVMFESVLFQRPGGVAPPTVHLSPSNASMNQLCASMMTIDVAVLFLGLNRFDNYFHF
eukprot:3969028-Ditylum_brightwellii.AAC.1